MMGIVARERKRCGWNKRGLPEGIEEVYSWFIVSCMVPELLRTEGGGFNGQCRYAE